MKKIIKTLLVVMVVVLALTVFVGCEEECQHTGGTATCTEAAVCEVCGESYGAALGHVLEKLPAIDATCSKEGRTEGSYCKVCKATVVAQQPIEKTEHVWVANEDRDFTCELDGFTGGNHCEICGVQDGNVVVTPAHCVWGEDYVYAEPTCGKAGILAHDCTVCGTKEKVSDIPATGEHSFTVDVPAKDPTCLDGYTAHKACEVCGAPNEDYEVIPGDPENGHHFAEENTFVYAEPTCTEQGMLAGYCSYCEKPYGLSYIPALGHTWEGGDCETTGTCSVCGAVSEGPIHTLVDGACSVCGYVLVETAEELVAALEAGKKVLLMNDIEMDAAIGHPYGGSGKVGVVQRGGELNGNGYTLTVHGEYAILTYGGTIKNLTVDAGFRAIVLYTPQEDVILDNVTVYGDDIVYGLNTQEYPTLEGIDIVVKNSTICGWISFAGTYASVTFENCEFVQGVAYTDVIGRLVRPYVSTTFTNCTFINNAYLDLSALAEGETVTLVGCKVAGVDVTVDVFTTEENHAEIPFTYEAPKDVELVLTAVEGGVSFHRHGYKAVVTAPTCTAAGKTVYTCACGHTYEEAGEAATDHADANGDFKCDSCSTKMLPADGTALTIPQALAIAKLAGTSYTTQKYYITGIVTNVYNTTYGNLYLKDADGNQICIYGLYTWDKAVRYDKMEYKPVEGDELTVYTVLGMYNTTAQGKDAWMDEVVAHEHDYKAVVTAPTCTKVGYTTHTCSICDGYYKDAEVPALGHTTESGVCDNCGLTIGGDAAPVEVKVSKSAADIMGLAGLSTTNGTSVNNKEIALDGNISIICSQGKAGTAPSYYSPAIRLYQNGATLTVKGTGMKTIVITVDSSAGDGPISVSGGTASALTSMKYTITVNEGVDEVVITTTGTDKNSRVYVSNIEVVYEQ